MNYNKNFDTYDPPYNSDGNDNEKNKHDEFNNNNNNAAVTITNRTKGNNVDNFAIFDEVNNHIADTNVFIVNLNNNNVGMDSYLDNVKDSDCGPVETDNACMNNDVNDVANGDSTFSSESVAKVNKSVATKTYHITSESSSINSNINNKNSNVELRTKSSTSRPEGGVIKQEYDTSVFTDYNVTTTSMMITTPVPVSDVTPSPTSTSTTTTTIGGSSPTTTPVTISYQNDDSHYIATATSTGDSSSTMTASFPLTADTLFTTTIVTADTAAGLDSSSSTTTSFPFESDISLSTATIATTATGDSLSSMTTFFLLHWILCLLQILQPLHVPAIPLHLFLLNQELLRLLHL